MTLAIPTTTVATHDDTLGPFAYRAYDLRSSWYRSTTRRHGTPHRGQAPRSEVPARTHGSTSSSGKVAKCAAGYGSWRRWPAASR
jgi:hypothetical protein